MQPNSEFFLIIYNDLLGMMQWNRLQETAIQRAITQFDLFYRNIRLVPNAITIFKKAVYVYVHIALECFSIQYLRGNNTVHTESFQYVFFISKKIPSVLVFFQIVWQYFFFTHLSILPDIHIFKSYGMWEFNSLD